MSKFIIVLACLVAISCGSDQRSSQNWEEWCISCDYRNIDELLMSIEGRYREYAFYQTGGTGHRQYLIEIDDGRELKVLTDRYKKVMGKPHIRPKSKWVWLDKGRGELFAQPP